MAANDGPAYPQLTHRHDSRGGMCSVTDPQQPGMTIRDEFAKAVLASASGDWLRGHLSPCGAPCGADELAKDCYRLAAAMIEERSKNREES